jgi:hypothetical protein
LTKDIPRFAIATSLSLVFPLSKLTKDDFLPFAKYCKISEKVVANSLADFGAKLEEMGTLIRQSFLSKKTQDNYLALIT